MLTYKILSILNTLKKPKVSINLTFLRITKNSQKSKTVVIT